MPLEEQFIKRNGELQQKVKEEIEKVKEGQSERNIVQLQTILSELQTSSRQKNIILSYPRIIIDSWDYSDYLGMELVELAELYKKIYYSNCEFHSNEKCYETFSILKLLSQIL